MQSKTKHKCKCKHLSQEDYENCVLMFGILLGQDRVDADNVKKLLTRLKLLLATPAKK